MKHLNSLFLDGYFLYYSIALGEKVLGNPTLHAWTTGIRSKGFIWRQDSIEGKGTLKVIVGQIEEATSKGAVSDPS